MQLILESHNREESRKYVCDMLAHIVCVTKTTFETTLISNNERFYGVKVMEQNYIGHFACEYSPSSIKHLQDVIDRYNLPIYYHLTKKYCIKDGCWSFFLDVFMK